MCSPIRLILPGEKYIRGCDPYLFLNSLSIPVISISKISAKKKKALVIIHGLTSLILALAIPNNYLNEIDVVKKLYEQNQFWIAGSMLVLLFLFIIIFGTALTSIVARMGFGKSEQKESLMDILNI